MSLRKLPNIKAEAPAGIGWDLPGDILSKWDTTAIAARSDEASITIYDPIGSDMWGEGVTSKRIGAALRSIGDKDVTVYLNSPGGDFFEGIAIYNLLREHPRKVTVKVIALAASAASVIAMAGDEILIAKAGFLMIHNAWALVIGNRHDLNGAAEIMAEFDASMSSLYADVTGIREKDIAKMMDDETWLRGEKAVEKNFATGLLPADEIGADETGASAMAAVRKIDVALAKQGLPRSERRHLLNEIRGMSGAVPDGVTHDADTLAGIMELTKKFRGEK